MNNVWYNIIMKKILTASQMKKIDKQTIEDHGVPSLVLMERAALSVAISIMSNFPDASKIYVICGPGNNGGDGVAIARLLQLKGKTVVCTILGDSNKYSPQLQEEIAIAKSYNLHISYAIDESKIKLFDLVVDSIDSAGYIDFEEVVVDFEEVVGNFVDFDFAVDNSDFVDSSDFVGVVDYFDFAGVVVDYIDFVEVAVDYIDFAEIAADNTDFEKNSDYIDFEGVVVYYFDFVEVDNTDFVVVVVDYFDSEDEFVYYNIVFVVVDYFEFVDYIDFADESEYYNIVFVEAVD